MFSGVTQEPKIRLAPPRQPFPGHPEQSQAHLQTAVVSVGEVHSQGTSCPGDTASDTVSEANAALDCYILRQTVLFYFI